MTSDQRTRSAERSGDRVAWLTERMRRGDRAPWICSHCHHGRGGYWRIGKDYPPDPDGGVPWRECPDCQGTGRAPFRSAVELAAYCGDEAARAVLGEDTYRLVEGQTGGWPNGLARWPGALERAALAACEVWERTRTKWAAGNLHRWAAGNLRRTDEALQAARAHIDDPSVGDTLPWTDGPVGSLCTGLAAVPRNNAFLVDAITEAARLSDPAAVRAGICAALVDWALDGR